MVVDGGKRDWQWGYGRYVTRVATNRRLLGAALPVTQSQTVSTFHRFPLLTVRKSKVSLTMTTMPAYPTKSEAAVIAAAEKLMVDTMARYDPSHDAYHGRCRPLYHVFSR